MKTIKNKKILLYILPFCTSSLIVTLPLISSKCEKPIPEPKTGTEESENKPNTNLDENNKNADNYGSNNKGDANTVVFNKTTLRFILEDNTEISAIIAMMKMNYKLKRIYQLGILLINQNITKLMVNLSLFKAKIMT